MSGHLFLKKSLRKIWRKEKNAVSLHSLTRTRAFSSAGLEHLPYKQRVGGSNPSTPTQNRQHQGAVGFFLYAHSCHDFAACVCCLSGIYKNAIYNKLLLSVSAIKSI